MAQVAKNPACGWAIGFRAGYDRERKPSFNLAVSSAIDGQGWLGIRRQICTRCPGLAGELFVLECMEQRSVSQGFEVRMKRRVKEEVVRKTKF